jgi:hypothetical protein
MNFPRQIRGVGVSGQVPHAETRTASDAHKIQSESSEENNKAFTTLATRYSASHLCSKMRCNICGGKATDMIHITSTPRPVLGVFESAVTDTLIPVCEVGLCDTRGNAIVHRFCKYGLPKLETTTYETCGGKSKMKLCAGCRFTHKEVSQEVDNNIRLMTGMENRDQELKSEDPGRVQITPMAVY